MIGCTVTSLNISGIRLVWIMLRFTMTHDCWAMLVGRVRTGSIVMWTGVATLVMRLPPLRCGGR